MPRIQKRTYSKHTSEAAMLLGKLIRLARKERKLTAEELAERTGISRSTLQRIEKGDPKVEIGVVFEAATIVGVNLFDADDNRLSAQIARADDKIALLPKHIHKSSKGVRDEF
jgi:transcriptional regulator with XRE-family HTH domain